MWELLVADYDRVVIVAATLRGASLRAGFIFVERNVGAEVVVRTGEDAFTVALPAEMVNQPTPRVGVELDLIVRKINES